MTTRVPSRRIVAGMSILALAVSAFACGGTESAAAPVAAKPPAAKPAAETPLLPPNAEAVPTPDEAADKAIAWVVDRLARENTSR